MSYVRKIKNCCNGQCSQCQKPKLTLLEASEIAENFEKQFMDGDISRDKYEQIKKFLSENLDRNAIAAYLATLNQ